VRASSSTSDPEEEQQQHKGIVEWRSVCVDKIIELLDCTKRVVQSPQQARGLALNEREKFSGGEDPMSLVQSLRLHLYLVDDNSLQLLERVQLISKLSGFVAVYRQCVGLASTPLPFGPVQMGRAFLFPWTFTPCLWCCGRAPSATRDRPRFSCSF
jgi:hypothetical protein